MAPIVLIAPLCDPIKFLNPTESKFLSSIVKSSPDLLPMAYFKNETMSSNLSACSATLARNIFSSIFKNKVLKFKNL